MRLKILAPHQEINGAIVDPGKTVEVDNKTFARQLINSGYAVEADEVEVKPVATTRLYDTPARPVDVKKED